jgi:acyl-CoA thioesterase
MDEKKKAVYFRKVQEEPYPRLLGIRLRDVGEGYAVCEMRYTPAMTNISGIAHGGAIFSLIDEAFEISSNSHEHMAVALNINITYMRPPQMDALLVAEAREVHRTRRTASYAITVKDGDKLIAACQALVYIKDDPLPFLAES